MRFQVKISRRVEETTFISVDVPSALNAEQAAVEILRKSRRVHWTRFEEHPYAESVEPEQEA